jgi:serine/threonine protein kinase
LQSQIGKGSFGKIILANCKDTNHTVAIKYIDLQAEGSEKELVENEIKLHKQLIHPNIISLYSVIDESESCKRMFLIMEYYDARDLWHYLETPLTMWQSTNVLKQLTHAVNYCHNNKIMHRDVKLENVLYHHDDNIAKLLDFGFAITFETPHTPRGYMFCGTTEYQAYEMACLEKYDERVDNWAMGIIYYELITQKSPYSGDTMIETYKNIRTKELTSDNIENVFKDEMWNIISGLLNKDVDERTTLDYLLKDVDSLIAKIENELS